MIGADWGVRLELWLQSLWIQPKPQIPLLQLKIFYHIRQVFAFACYSGAERNIKASIVCYTATFLTAELCQEGFFLLLFMPQNGAFLERIRDSAVTPLKAVCLEVLLPWKRLLFADIWLLAATSAGSAHRNKKRLWTWKVCFPSTSPYLFCQQVNIL